MRYSKLILAFLLSFSVGAAHAKGEFGTGLIVGLLFGGSSSNSQNHNVINKIGNEPTFEDRLYTEYRRNEALIKKGVSNSQELIIRNDQIAKEFASNAKQRYIDGFILVLTPVSRRVIENRTVDNSKPFMSMNASIIGGEAPAPSFSSHRDEIRYEISFSGGSPQPITDFNVVSVNGKPAEKLNGKWFYTYQQQWGNNAINVEVQDRKRPALKFELDSAYVVQEPETIQYNANSSIAYTNTDKSLGMMLRFFPVLLLLPLVIMMLRSKPN